MHPRRNHRHRETPTKRRNPSGDVRWVARYTGHDGQRKKAGADLGKYAGHSVQTANARYVQPLDRSAERVRSAIG